ncbi:hypothetical protein EUX98_g4731 [Antrodiella citrinella]|uniref:Coiled-coil domain-containing protein 16 n=1 Tax=Antrodiella citrinella TaxID=2447956 RepID=A0A4S4MTA1_9APHY|nr:hypothetical protein EUX98_g4731 [Antrodiella citrinella]
MADVRALLKAKRQEARVNHPLASYSSTGQLRCLACSTIVKQAASWVGHVGSKTHRINAVKLRESELAQQMLVDEESAQAKRKSEALEDDDGDVDMSPDTKKRKGDLEADASTHGFPDDFFSDPSQAPLPAPDDDDENADAAPSETPLPPVDAEWELFQQAVLNPPTNDDRREAFDRATIAAEPVLASEVPEGFPQALAQATGTTGESQPELSEEALRRQKEQDERELIMDRLMDEERAQEEADAKVTMLKTKLDALKRKREAAKAARTKQRT